MVDNLCTGDCMFKSKRERLKSLPVNYDCVAQSPLPLDCSRRHRNSDVTINKSLLNTSLREVSSEPQSNSWEQKTEVGVKSFYEWKPRRHSGSSTITGRANDVIHEGNILVERNVDRKFVLSPSEFQDLCYKADVSRNNPFKSELFLRVLYMLSCTSNDDQEPLPSIQDQFLSDEQIRENLLKELRDGVSRLNQDLNQESNGKSGTVTPGEFICNSIPNMIRRHSLVNIRSVEELSHVSSMASMEGSQQGENSDATDASGHQQLHSNLNQPQQHHHHQKRKKLTGREKNLFAPLTY